LKTIFHQLQTFRFATKKEQSLQTGSLLSETYDKGI
jgi:hypothetical protein